VFILPYLCDGNYIRIRIKVCFDPADSEHRSRPSTALISDLHDQASRSDRSDRFALNAARTQPLVAGL
jgi:hypothetical protein